MSLRDNVTSQQLLAVSLAVIMLVSVGGMAFAGGVGAQTGGTFDDPIEAQETVNSELNIADSDGDVVLLGPSDGDGGVDSANAEVLGDGSVEVSGPADSLTGVALTPERVDGFVDVNAAPSDRADFLDQAVTGNLSVESETDTAYPAIFADFDPQSDFSQINVTGNETRGTHDYIVIASADNVPDTPDAEGIIAASVENGDTSNNEVLVNNSATFEDAVDELVGTSGDSEQPVENQYLENVLFTGVTNGVGDETITEVTLGDESNFDAGQTFHSEKVTLNPGADETFYSNISAADSAAESGDSIDVAAGDAYGDLEGDNVTLTTSDLTVTGANQTAVSDRVDADTAASVDESTISVPVNLNASGVTVDGFEIEDDVVVNQTDASDVTIADTVVEQPDVGTGIDAQSSATITNTAVISDTNPDLTNSDDIGIEVNNSDVTISESLLIGHAVQINASEGTDVTPYYNNNLFEDPRSQSAVPLNDSGSVVGDRIPGSVALADEDAEDGNVIEISAGDYNNVGVAGEGDLTVETDEISLNGADGAAIWDNTDVNGSTNVSVDGLTFYGNLTSTTGDADLSVTNTDVVNNSEESVDDNTLNISAASSVTIDTVTVDGVAANEDAINISTATTSTSVQDVTVDDIGDGAGVNVTETAEDLTIDGVTVNADDAEITGINVDGIDTDADNTYEIFNADLNDLGDNSVGIAVAEAASVADGDQGTVAVSDNTIDGASQFIGIEYDLEQSVGTAVVDNTILGDDVTGGADSVAINVTAISETGTDEVLGAPSTDDGPEFSSNTLSGHARIINVPADVSLNYDDFVRSDEIDNTIGTLVFVPDGDQYADAFADNEGGYLPGSISEAVDLVEEQGVSEADLVVRDPSTVSAGPQVYDDEVVTFPGVDTINVTGENADVTAQTNFVINAANDQLNNHELSTLTIEAGGNSAIEVSSANSQSVFEDLDVSTTGDNPGFEMTGTDGDVNVVEIRDSDFTVADEADGIVLDGDSDDRYGFEIERNTVRSAGLTNEQSAADNPTVGIDLSNVEKPGKQDPELDTQLVVEDNTIGGFDIQVNPEAATFDAEDGAFANTTTAFEYLVDNNTFDESVIITNASGADATENETIAGGSGTANVYGDIGTAVDNVDDIGGDVDGIIVDATATDVFDYTDSEDGLVVGSSNNGDVDNVTVLGGDAEISGEVEFNGAGTIDEFIFTGFDIVADNDFVTPTVTADVTNTTDEAPYDYEVDAVDVTGDFESTVVTVTDAGGDGNLEVSDTSVSHDIEVDVAEAVTDVDSVDLNGADEFDGDITELLDLTANVTGVQVDGFGDSVTFSDVTVAAGDNTEAPNRGGYVFDGGAGTFEIVDSTVDVEGDGIAFNGVTGTVDVSQTTIAAAEEVDPLAGDDFDVAERSGSGIGVSGVAGATGDITLFESDVTSVDDDGVNVTDTDGSYTLDNTDVASQSAVGVNASTAAGGALTIQNETTVDAVANATNVYSTAAAGDLVIQNSSFEGATALFTGADVADDTFNRADDRKLIGNVFLGDAAAEDTHDIYIADNSTFNSSGPADISLNYLGDDRGPFSSDAAGIYADESQETFIYDPFLTTDDLSAVEDAEDTTEFGHDVHMTGNDITTVAFPAQVEDGLTVDDVFDDELAGAVYELENGEFTQVTNFDREVEAFDAFVVQNTGETVPALVEYDSDQQNTNLETYEFQQGLNFVPATQAGNVSDSLFPGGSTDFVQAPFNLGGNLYGVDRSAADGLVDPADAGFGSNFQSGDLDNTTVHPHAGYLVIVNEESNDGLIVGEQITKPATVTTGNVNDRTSYNATTPASLGQVV